MIKIILSLNKKISLRIVIVFIVFLISFIIVYLINLSKENIYSKTIDNKGVSIVSKEIDNYNESYTYLISEYKTEFNEKNLNRSINIKLASNKINNTIILPGEIFSYNEVVGNRTEEAGFKIATVYQGGKVVEGIGGGICQVSTTLYNATLYANLIIIERKSHLFLPSYISAGRDATVADEYIDFKFKNTRKYPIKIVSSANNGIIDIKIYGREENDECDVEIQSISLEIVPYKIIYNQDNEMKIGEEKIIQKRKRRIYK